MKRVFLIVLDSFGIGEMPDAEAYGDINVNTLRSVSKSPYFHMEHMRDMGLFQIDGVGVGEKTEHPTAAYARMTERSRGKDTTIGHWEIAGIYSPKPLPTYPNGFPEEVLEEFRLRTGRVVIILLLLTAMECISVAVRAKDVAGTIIAAAMGGLIAFQSFVNIGVATFILPNTGLPLPFVSYGLTSLLSLYIGMGIVLNIRLQARKS